MMAGRVLGSRGQAGRDGRSRQRGCARVGRPQERGAAGRPVLSVCLSPPHSLAVYTCAALLMPVACLAFAESVSLLPSLRLSLCLPVSEHICQQGRGGRPSALRSPDWPLDYCSANDHSLPTSLSLCSRSIFPAPLMLGLTLSFVLISRVRVTVTVCQF